MATSLAIKPSNKTKKHQPSSLYPALIPHPWLYFHMHNSLADTATEAYDAGFAETNGQDSALFTNGKLTVQGTTTNIWTANPGWLTPSGDNYIQSTDEDVRAFFDMSTLTGVGGLLICFRMQIGTALLATEYILSHSGLETVSGGFEISVNAADKVYINMREQNNSGGTNVCADSTAQSVDTEYAYCIYLDCKSGYASLYRDGVEGASALNAMPTPYPVFNAARGMVIAGRSGSLANNKLNQNLTGALLRDCFVVRAESDIAADIGAIAQEYTNNVGVIPRTLVKDYL